MNPEEAVLTSLPSSSAFASIHHDKTAAGSTGENELRGKCCPEDDCVISNDELEGYECLQCVNCDKSCHYFFVQPFDDNDPRSERYSFLNVCYTHHLQQMLDV
jgi:hypothetical protein